MMIEANTRAAIVAEALSFTGTKYHHAGRIKGVGVDCLTFIVCVAENVGLIDRLDLPAYSSQFGAHRDAETYLEGILRYCHEVETPLPGDIIIYRFGRTFSHAGIVINWPTIIHAHAKAGVIIDDAEACSWLKYTDSKGQGATLRPRKFFSYG